MAFLLLEKEIKLIVDTGCTLNGLGQSTVLGAVSGSSDGALFGSVLVPGIGAVLG